MNRSGLLQALAGLSVPAAGAMLAALRRGDASAQVAARSAALAAAAASNWQDAVPLAVEESRTPRQQWVKPPKRPAIVTASSVPPLSLAALAQMKQRRRRRLQQQCECCSSSESDGCSGDESPSSVLCLLDDCCAAMAPASAAASAAAQDGPDCKPKLQPSWLDGPQQRQNKPYSKQAGSVVSACDGSAVFRFDSWRPFNLLQASGRPRPPACGWLPGQQQK